MHGSWFLRTSPIDRPMQPDEMPVVRLWAIL
jgi:hypothetical protein